MSKLAWFILKYKIHYSRLDTTKKPKKKVEKNKINQIPIKIYKPPFVPPLNTQLQHWARHPPNLLSGHLTNCHDLNRAPSLLSISNPSFMGGGTMEWPKLSLHNRQTGGNCQCPMKSVPRVRMANHKSALCQLSPITWNYTRNSPFSLDFLFFAALHCWESV